MLTFFMENYIKNQIKKTDFLLSILVSLLELKNLPYYYDNILTQVHHENDIYYLVQILHKIVWKFFECQLLHQLEPQNKAIFLSE